MSLTKTEKRAERRMVNVGVQHHIPPRLLNHINEAANQWNKTKDERYKKEWYQLLSRLDETVSYSNSTK
jgi:hypothetical protein